MSKILCNVCIMFLLFQGILDEQLNMPDFFRYWDEFLTCFLLMCWLLKAISGSFFSGKIVIKKSAYKMTYPWFLVVVTGLLGNMVFHYVESAAIVRDVVGFLKFPVCFLAIRQLGWDKKIAKALKSTSFFFIKATVIVMFIFGMLSLYFDLGMSQEGIRMGIHPYQFLFSHPTALVTVSILIICLLCANECGKNYLLYYIMLGINIVLSMRTKGLAFIAVFIFMKYGGNWLKRYKIIYWIGIFLVVLVAAYSKLQLYMSFSSSGREVLWIGAFTLLRMCFPIGSGFGTFASHVSAAFGSEVYTFIRSYDFWASNGEATAVFGDTGFPYYIGQFGVIGMFFLTVAVWRMIHIWHQKKGEKLYRGLAEDLLMIYIAIALTSEALLITYGCEYGIVLAALLQLDGGRNDGWNTAKKEKGIEL